MFRCDEPAIAENRRALEDIPQFANIPRPAVVDEQLTRFARDPSRWPAETAADLCKRIANTLRR